MWNKRLFGWQVILQAVESAGIKFPDGKTTGVSLRSQRIKLPANVGQKKSKGIEQMLQELEIGMPKTDPYLTFNGRKALLLIVNLCNRKLSTNKLSTFSFRPEL